MDTFDINRALAAGITDRPGILPKLEDLREQEFVFEIDFGLDSLPSEPGVMLLRGARQFGKSTWLQQQIEETVCDSGPGSAFYLNGDELRDTEALIRAIRTLLPLFRRDAPVRRLFIDEITAVAKWELAIKRLADAGELRRILVMTTGSKASDLRRGTERLPGRKGKLGRTTYVFTPISFSEFERVCGDKFEESMRVPAYLLTGGSPPACAALAETGHLPEYITEMVRDWIYGAFAGTGRSRAMFLGVMDCLHRFGGTPVGQSKLAREAGLANNTVAQGYVELLSDMLCMSSSFAWDSSKGRANRRKPCKFHLTNLLAAICWHPNHPRTPGDVVSLPEACQGMLLEWLVAQECWRRAVIRGDEVPDTMLHWQGGGHELDFVLSPDRFIEVKRGRTGPLDFAWFPATFPRGHLTVVGANRFETDQITGVTLSDFLRDSASIPG